MPSKETVTNKNNQILEGGEHIVLSFFISYFTEMNKTKRRDQEVQKPVNTGLHDKTEHMFDCVNHGIFY